MAKVYVTEYAQALIMEGRQLPVGIEPPLAVQVVAIGGASVASSAFNAKTQFIEIHTDAIMSYAMGAAPTATANTTRMAANTTKFVGVPRGTTHKIAVITNT